MCLGSGENNFAWVANYERDPADKIIKSWLYLSEIWLGYRGAWCC